MAAPPIKLLLASGGSSGPPSVTDSFNRADNSSSIGNADSGETWTVWGGGGVSFGITSNTAYQPTNGSGTNVDVGTYIDGGTVARTIQVTITTAQTGNSVGAGLTFRHEDVNNHFLFMFYRSGGGSLFWFLQKVVVGANTTIANASASAITGTLKVVDTGSNIKVYIDGVQVGTGGGYSETALNTKTKQGLYINYTSLGGANSGTGWRFNDYTSLP